MIEVVQFSDVSDVSDVFVAVLWCFCGGSDWPKVFVEIILRFKRQIISTNPQKNEIDTV